MRSTTTSRIGALVGAMTVAVGVAAGSQTYTGAAVLAVGTRLLLDRARR